MTEQSEPGRRTLVLDVLPEELAIVRLPPDEEIPRWLAGVFWSVSRTAKELSLVVEESLVPPDLHFAGGWKAMRVEGKLDFSEVGILAFLSGTLAEADISLFALSTFDTDYILVRHEDLERAGAALELAGATVHR